jgi:hypothetical protein
VTKIVVVKQKAAIQPSRRRFLGIGDVESAAHIVVAKRVDESMAHSAGAGKINFPYIKRL